MIRSDRAGRLSIPLVLLLSFSVPTVAHAGEGDVAAARALFTEGRKLAAVGNYAAACPQFAESYRLDPGIGTSFNLADCEEHLGHTASAWLRFLDVAAATKAAGQPERERVARARAAAIEPRLSKVVVKVPSPLLGIIVRRDGDVIPPELWGVPLPVDPGKRILTAAAPGRRTWTVTVTVPPSLGLTSIVVPTLEAAPPAPIDRPSPASILETPIASRGPGEARGLPRLSLWLGAIGLASLATGTVFALRFETVNSEAKALCQTNNLCPTSEIKTQHDNLVSTAKNDRTFAFVGAGVGAGALIAATSWWWHSKRAQGPSPQVGVDVAPIPIIASTGVQLGIDVTW